MAKAGRNSSKADCEETQGVARGYQVLIDAPLRGLGGKLIEYKLIAYTSKKQLVKLDFAESLAAYLERSGAGGQIVDDTGKVVKEWKRKEEAA